MISAVAAARGGGLLVMLVVAWQVAGRRVTFTPAGAILAVLDEANFVFPEGGHVLFLFFGLTRTGEFGG